MGLINTISNSIKAAVGYQQSFEELLAAHDVTRAVAMMTSRSEAAMRHLQEYEVSSHKVMSREDRAVYDKKGNFQRWSKRNKLPIAYQKYLNEIALVFLYGRPVKWTQLSENTDYAYSYYKELMREIRFDSAIREAKRAAGAEGVSAILYHTFRDEETNKPRLLLNVLCKANNDDIYVIKDQYKRLKAFGWGYYLTEQGNRTVHHIDIYTAHSIYRCKRGAMGWDVELYDNPAGKIPVLLFEQEPEHKDVQPLIEKIEDSESVEADVIERFANPAMVATAEVLNSLPKQEEEAKLFILKNGGQLSYLTWNDASESKRNQFERLDKHILSKSFTPNIDFDNMKSLGNLSAKAIRKVMLLAVIKAERHKEKHDGYMNRHASLMIAIMGNVLDYVHKGEFDRLNLGHEFQEPFGDDVSEMLADISKQFNDGALSRETYVELSYLVKDAHAEMERIKAEQAEQMEQQMAMQRMDAFEPTD